MFLRPWNPLNELQKGLRGLDGTTTRVDRLFSEMQTLLEAAAAGRLPGTLPALPMLAGATWPALNLWETDSALYLELELPGVAQDAVDLAIQGRELTIKARRQDSHTNGHNANNATPTWHRRERVFGEFTRTVTLPLDVDADKAAATFTNGVLMVTLPKPTIVQPRKIAIRADR